MTIKGVTVVGAGIVGLMCALRLAEAGVRVTVIEALGADAIRPGSRNASISAAGMLAPFSETAQHPDFEALCAASFALWKARAAAALWRDFVVFDGADVATAAGARFVAEEGVVDPERVYEGILSDARQAGVSFKYGLGIDDGVSREIAATTRTLDRGAFVVLAPGAGPNASLTHDAPVLKRVSPAKGCLLNVELAKPIARTLHAPGFYIARRWDGACVLGSTMEMGRADLAVEQSKIDALLAAANAHFGGGVRQRGEAWAGVRAMSPDWAPMIGPTRQGLAVGALIAAGASRNGWLLAPIIAEIICAYVMGQDIPRLWAAFHPDRFDT